MTETPESPSESDPPTEPNSKGAPSTEASSEEGQTMGSPLTWLAAGLLAAAIVPFVVQHVLNNAAVLPEEYLELSRLEFTDEEQNARIIELERGVTVGNVQRLLFMSGAAFAIVFGLVAGFIYRRPVMGVVGAIAGAGVAFGLATVAAEPILGMEESAVGGGGDTHAILLHSVQWLLFGLAAVVAISIGSLNPMTGVRALGAVVLASMLGGLLYVIVGTILDPMSQTGTAAPTGGKALYFWASLPPALVGIFLSRSRRE